MDNETLRQMATATLDQAENMKRLLVAEAAPGASDEEQTMPPIFGYLMDGDEEFEHVPTWAISKALDINDGEMPRAIGSCIRAIRTQIHPGRKIRMVIFVHEAYHADKEAWEQATERWGSLSRAYKMDPDSQVFECLALAMAKDNLVGGYEYITAMRKFRFDDGQQMEFDEDFFGELTEFAGGLILEAMQQTLEADDD